VISQGSGGLSGNQGSVGDQIVINALGNA